MKKVNGNFFYFMLNSEHLKHNLVSFILNESVVNVKLIHIFIHILQYLPNISFLGISKEGIEKKRKKKPDVSITSCYNPTTHSCMGSVFVFVLVLTGAVRSLPLCRDCFRSSSSLFLSQREIRKPILIQQRPEVWGQKRDQHTDSVLYVSLWDICPFYHTLVISNSNKKSDHLHAKN